MPKATTPHPDAILLGGMIRQLRTQRGWNIRTCAEHLELTPSHLGILEMGGNMPSIHLLLRVARVFGVQAWTLMKTFEEARNAEMAAEAAAAAARR